MRRYPASWLYRLRSPTYYMPALFFVFILALPRLTDNDYLRDTAILILLWAAMAGAWNLCGGYAGALSLGHAAFFGIGAYTSTLLFIKLGVSPWLGMLVGAVLATLAGLIIGYLSTRLRGPYFALASLAFAEVVLLAVSRWYDFTRGGEGLPVPFRPGWQNMMFYGKETWIYLVLILVVIVWAVSVYIENSKLGYQLAGVRENEDAAQALGINTHLVKVTAIGLSTFLTALGGTFYAQYVGFVDPYYVLSLDLSVKFALIAIIGGMATALGPLLGSVLLTSLEMYLRATLGAAQSGLYMVIYGFLLIAVVLFIPQGIVVGIPGLLRRWVWKEKKVVAGS